MMKLWYSASEHAILDHSYVTPAQASTSCKLATYADTLFCVFLEQDTHRVQYLSKTADTAWTAPADVVDRLPARGTPSVFVFNERLHVVFNAVQGASVAIRATYDDTRHDFPTQRLGVSFRSTPAFVQFKAKLHMFYLLEDSDSIGYRSSPDAVQWSRPALVKHVNGIGAVSHVNPVAVVYQGLIHVVYKTLDGKFYLTRFDGDRAWTRSRVFIPVDYGHSPGVVVHNGLLHLLFADNAGAATHDLYHYCYDGNALSPVTLSSNLAATQSIGVGVLAGKLHAVYCGV